MAEKLMPVSKGGAIGVGVSVRESYKNMTRPYNFEHYLVSIKPPVPELGTSLLQAIGGKANVELIASRQDSSVYEITCGGGDVEKAADALGHLVALADPQLNAEGFSDLCSDILAVEQ